MSETISYNEAAKLLGVVPDYIYQLVSKGSLHAIKVPGTREKRLSLAEVRKYGRLEPVQAIQPTIPANNQLIGIQATIDVSPASIKRQQLIQLLSILSENTKVAIQALVTGVDQILKEDREAYLPILHKVAEYPISEEEMRELVYTTHPELKEHNMQLVGTK